MGRKPKEQTGEVREKRKYTKRKKRRKRNSSVKTVTLEFNLKDENEKELFQVLSNMETVRRTIRVLSFYEIAKRENGKVIGPFSPLESELLKIVKYHAKRGGGGSVIPQYIPQGNFERKEKRKQIQIEERPREEREQTFPVKTGTVNSGSGGSLEDKLDDLTNGGLK